MTTEQNPVFGIDLGTTNTCIAKCSLESNEPLVVPNGDSSKPTTPSVLCVTSESKIVVGQTAKNKLGSREVKNCVFESKRKIADDKLWKGDGTFTEAENYPIVNGKHLTPITAASAIIEEVTTKNPLVMNLAQKPKVVVTFPAYFSDTAKARTKQAVELTGNVEVLDMIEEPIAATYSYMCGEDLKNKTVLVYDWGGGTFDVSVVRFDATGKGEVLSKKGDPQLGGADCDKALAFLIWNKYVEEKKKLGSNVPLKLEASDFKCSEFEDEKIQTKVALFRETAEKVKMDLTKATTVTAPFEDGDLLVEVTREEFNDCISSFLANTLNMVDTALELPTNGDAPIKPEEIDLVFLVGGSSKMLCVQEALGEKFGKEKCKCLDPDLAVAKGAAIYAHCLVAGKNNSSTFTKALITNIANKTYGTSCLELVPLPNGTEQEREFVANIIFKGDKLPITKTEKFFTSSDNQTCVKIDVYKSDSRNAKLSFEADVNEFEEVSNPDSDSNLLYFEKPVPQGTPIEVAFTLQPSGLLTVVGKSLVDTGYCKFDLRLVGTLNETAMVAARRQISDALKK